jgi:hypothetical protein
MAATLEPEQSGAKPARKLVRILQVFGAIVVTACALWFLFGVPAHILFDAYID